MTTALQQLGALQKTARALVEAADDNTVRGQYHPDLSPLGWHLGHCVYTECYWLHEAVRGDRQFTAPIEDLYIPIRTAKPERGYKLPVRKRLLQWVEQAQNRNYYHLTHLNDTERRHPLHADDYLLHFLIQHYCQHLETMAMILHQKMLQCIHRPPVTDNPLRPVPSQRDSREIPGGQYPVGGQKPFAYDNELPLQSVQLDAFRIARRPVSNAEYLAFMESGGYHRRDVWGSDGWSWRQRTHTEHPDHWRRDGNGNWYGVGLRGARELAPDEPASGISFFEAEAYAHWAGGKLPHEYQWETASRLGLIDGVGGAWEWCGNTFHPYNGFTPFPYEEYSQPWFAKRHQVLRGASVHTQSPIRRPSFRNFYTPDKRHIFAGLRLVFE